MGTPFLNFITINNKPLLPEHQQLFFPHFEKYIRLTAELKQELAAKTHFNEFAKGDIVHSEKRVCTESHFILSGMLRSYFIKDGKEVTEYFSAEEEWCNSPRSLFTRQPDIYNIDAIEPTTCFTIHVNDLVYLFDHFPEMERYARLSMGTLMGHLLERITSMRFTTAKEKHEHFLRVYAAIHHRIPLGMVASYLGIAQETLSRLRAEK